MHKEEKPCKSQVQRTKEVFFLGPSRNLQGRYKFITLNTTKKIVWRSWDLIPMPDMVITQVNTFGGIGKKYLTFTYRQGCLIGLVLITGVGAKSEEEER